LIQDSRQFGLKSPMAIELSLKPIGAAPAAPALKAQAIAVQ
jgi:hypothetical protein